MKSFLVFSIMVFACGFSGTQSSLINPMKYFASKPRSVEEKSYYANVSTARAIEYFKSLGMIKYIAENYDPQTIRFRDAKRSVFVMVFRESSNRVYIVMSRNEYVDEIDV